MYIIFHKYTKSVENRQILDLLLPASYEFIVSYHFYIEKLPVLFPSIYALELVRE